MEQVDGALGPAQFHPGHRSLDLDIRRCAVASRALVLFLLATLRELGCGVQRPLAGDLDAGKRIPDGQLLQRDRPPRGWSAAAYAATRRLAAACRRC